MNDNYTDDWNLTEFRERLRWLISNYSEVLKVLDLTLSYDTHENI